MWEAAGCVWLSLTKHVETAELGLLMWPGPSEAALLALLVPQGSALRGRLCIPSQVPSRPQAYWGPFQLLLLS